MPSAVIQAMDMNLIKAGELINGHTLNIDEYGLGLVEGIKDWRSLSPLRGGDGTRPQRY